MTDVFISYATSDRERARGVANALSARGWSVWWDRKIRAGQTFDDVIERELDTAKHIVVLWSDASVASEWVKNEAAVAVQRGVLIPVLLDNVKIPLEFRRKQTADLVGWDGDSSHHGLQALFEALDGARPQSAPPPASPAAPNRPARQSVVWTAAGAAGFALGCLVTYFAIGASRESGPSGTDTRGVAAGGATGVRPAGRGNSAPSGSDRQSTKNSLPTNLPTSYKGVFLDVSGFVKAGELTTLEWTLRNTGEKEIYVCAKAAEAQLIDQISGESWRALHSGGPAVSCQHIQEGGQSGAWGKFKLPTLDNRRFSFSLPILLQSPELPRPSSNGAR
jgi:hypothetical protein